MARVGKVKYKVNLQDMFGERVPDDEDFRGAVVQAVIDRIIERTESGIDKSGHRFKGYSAAYKKATGKSDPPDLKLTGDMLANIDIIDKSPQTITLGFPDETENAKAYNHTEGITVPRRDFFGLPKKELAAIASQFREELREIKEERKRGEVRVSENAALENLITDILSGNLDSELGIDGAS